jgi:phosphoribosylaminoimidazole carboxylase (NCAIR synthetase)
MDLVVKPFMRAGETLQIENVFVHLYGKKETRGGRKMGQ